MNPAVVAGARKQLGDPVPHSITPRESIFSKAATDGIYFNGWKLSENAAALDKPWIHLVAVYLTTDGDMVVSMDMLINPRAQDPAADVPAEFDPAAPMSVGRFSDFQAAERWVQIAGGVELRKRYAEPGDAAHGALMDAFKTMKDLEGEPA